MEPLSQRSWRRFVLILVLAGAWTAGLSPAQATRPDLPTLTERQGERLLAGKLVLTAEEQGSADKKLIIGVIEIAASAPEIWDVVLSNEHIIASSRAIKEVTTYKDEIRADGIRDLRLAYRLKVGWSEIRYNSARLYRADEAYMTWTLDTERPNDIKWTEGSYSTWPGSQSGTTVFLYKAFIETGKRIPDWLEEELTESSLKKYLTYVKKIAEQ